MAFVENHDSTPTLGGILPAGLDLMALDASSDVPCPFAEGLDLMALDAASDVPFGGDIDLMALDASEIDLMALDATAAVPEAMLLRAEEDKTIPTPAPYSDTVDYLTLKRMTCEDKEVRKLEKLLREICKLEGKYKLDKLQTEKIQRKEQVLLDLDTARGLAESRARDVLRRQSQSLKAAEYNNSSNNNNNSLSIKKNILAAAAPLRPLSSRAKDVVACNPPTAEVPAAEEDFNPPLGLADVVENAVTDAVMEDPSQPESFRPPPGLVDDVENAVTAAVEEEPSKPEDFSPPPGLADVVENDVTAAVEEEPSKPEEDIAEEPAKTDEEMEEEMEEQVTVKPSTNSAPAVNTNATLAKAECPLLSRVAQAVEEARARRAAAATAAAEESAKAAPAKAELSIEERAKRIVEEAKLRSLKPASSPPCPEPRLQLAAAPSPTKEDIEGKIAEALAKSKERTKEDIEAKIAEALAKSKERTEAPNAATPAKTVDKEDVEEKVAQALQEAIKRSTGNSKAATPAKSPDKEDLAEKVAQALQGAIKRSTEGTSSQAATPAKSPAKEDLEEKVARAMQEAIKRSTGGFKEEDVAEKVAQAQKEAVVRRDGSKEEDDVPEQAVRKLFDDEDEKKDVKTSFVHSDDWSPAALQAYADAAPDEDELFYGDCVEEDDVFDIGVECGLFRHPMAMVTATAAAAAAAATAASPVKMPDSETKKAHMADALEAMGRSPPGLRRAR